MAYILVVLSPPILNTILSYLIWPLTFLHVFVHATSVSRRRRLQRERDLHSMAWRLNYNDMAVYGGEQRSLVGLLPPITSLPLSPTARVFKILKVEKSGEKYKINDMCSYYNA